MRKKPSVSPSDPCSRNNTKLVALMITHHIHAPLRWTLLLCFAAALSIGQARAETWYLKIDGIPGVREEPGLPGWTVVLDLKASAAVPINPTNRVPGAPVFACE